MHSQPIGAVRTQKLRSLQVIIRKTDMPLLESVISEFKPDSCLNSLPVFAVQISMGGNFRAPHDFSIA